MTKANAPAYASEFGPGMSMCEWFAGQAIIGVLSRIDFMRRREQGALEWQVPPDELAAMAFEVADAMIAESAKGGAS